MLWISRLNKFRSFQSTNCSSRKIVKSWWICHYLNYLKRSQIRSSIFALFNSGKKSIIWVGAEIRYEVSDISAGNKASSMTSISWHRRVNFMIRALLVHKSLQLWYVTVTKIVSSWDVSLYFGPPLSSCKFVQWNLSTGVLSPAYGTIGAGVVWNLSKLQKYTH